MFTIREKTVILEVINSVAAVMASLLAFAALIYSLKIHRAQQLLTKTIHTEQKEIQKSQILLTQRQLIIPLWDTLASIKSFDLTNYHPNDPIKLANTLELVALCWEGELIDQQIIKRTFKDSYITLWELIGACNKSDEGYRLGREIQKENKAAAKLYRILLEEHENDGVISPLNLTATNNKKELVQ